MAGGAVDKDPKEDRVTRRGRGIERLRFGDSQEDRDRIRWEKEDLKG